MASEERQSCRRMADYLNALGVPCTSNGVDHRASPSASVARWRAGRVATPRRGGISRSGCGTSTRLLCISILAWQACVDGERCAPGRSSGSHGGHGIECLASARSRCGNCAVLTKGNTTPPSRSIAMPLYS
jgi:hypothetical protein